MKNQPSRILSLRTMVLAALAACVTSTSLPANAFGDVRGSIGRGGGFQSGGGFQNGGGYGDGRGGGGFGDGRGGRDDGRGGWDNGRDGRDDRGGRRGDLCNRYEAERLVDLMYRAAFNRAADYQGLVGFSREIMNRGTQGLVDSARMIGSSPEMMDTVRRVGSRRIVYNIYRVFFNREPDPSGLYNWTRQFDQGRGGDAMAGIVGSPEFAQNQL